MASEKEQISVICECCDSEFKVIYSPLQVAGTVTYCTFCGEEIEAEEDEWSEDDSDDSQEEDEREEDY